MHNPKDYITYRIERAEELYEDAVLLADKKRWKSCINRLYYCCFQMLDALLFSEGMRKPLCSLWLNFIETRRPLPVSIIISAS